MKLICETWGYSDDIYWGHYFVLQDKGIEVWESSWFDVKEPLDDWRHELNLASVKFNVKFDLTDEDPNQWKVKDGLMYSKESLTPEECAKEFGFDKETEIAESMAKEFATELKGATWTEIMQTVEFYRTHSEERAIMNKRADEDFANGKAALYITEIGTGRICGPLHVSSRK